MLNNAVLNCLLLVIAGVAIASPRVGRIPDFRAFAELSAMMTPLEMAAHSFDAMDRVEDEDALRDYLADLKSALRSSTIGRHHEQLAIVSREIDEVEAFLNNMRELEFSAAALAGEGDSQDERELEQWQEYYNDFRASIQDAVTRAEQCRASLGEASRAYFDLSDMNRDHIDDIGVMASAMAISSWPATAMLEHAEQLQVLAGDANDLAERCQSLANLGNEQADFALSNYNTALELLEQF